MVNEELPVPDYLSQLNPAERNEINLLIQQCFLHGVGVVLANISGANREMEFRHDPETVKWYKKP